MDDKPVTASEVMASLQSYRASEKELKRKLSLQIIRMFQETFEETIKIMKDACADDDKKHGE